MYKSFNSIGSPEGSSSPKAKRAPNVSKQHKNLRILNINFQSVRNKVRNIDVLIDTIKSDIRLGTKTWLSDEIESTYFFNPSLGFNIYRLDRPADPHGGVLIAVKNDIEVTNIERHSELELIKGIIKVDKKKMVLAAFYRHLNMTEPSYLESVRSAFCGIRSKFKTAIYVFGGDFNLPDIDWKKHTVTDSNYPHRVRKTFLYIEMDLNLEQVVSFPTRLQNTLDLVFMSHPSFKMRCKPLPPIGLKSDHQPVRTRLPRRKIYIWKKTNVDGIRSHFRTFAGQCCTFSAQSVEDMWTMFKSAISSAVSQHVPSKMSSTRQTHPWVDTKLRRHMRRKQRAHQKAKRSRKDKD